jgi:hypothetical protein
VAPPGRPLRSLPPFDPIQKRQEFMAKKIKGGKKDPEKPNTNVNNHNKSDTLLKGNKFHDRLVRYFLTNVIIFLPF